MIRYKFDIDVNGKKITVHHDFIANQDVTQQFRPGEAIPILYVVSVYVYEGISINTVIVESMPFPLPLCEARRDIHLLSCWKLENV